MSYILELTGRKDEFFFLFFYELYLGQRFNFCKNELKQFAWKKMCSLHICWLTRKKKHEKKMTKKQVQSKNLSNLMLITWYLKATQLQTMLDWKHMHQFTQWLFHLKKQKLTFFPFVLFDFYEFYRHFFLPMLKRKFFVFVAVVNFFFFTNC